MRDPALWDRIRHYAFPLAPAGEGDEVGSPPSALAARLREAEAWAPDYAQQAIEEYRRFVYLSLISQSQVTPSEIIDRVWHEHITDTRSYIDGFCQPLFGELLHHVPGSGPDETPRFEAQYDDTRALYAAEFGEEPPEDIWIHRSPAQIRSNRRRAVFARVAGVAGGIAVTWACNLLFGGVLGALFTGLVAGSILSLVLTPRAAGPRYASRNGDGSGCSSCGD